MEVEYVNFSYM